MIVWKLCWQFIFDFFNDDDECGILKIEKLFQIADAVEWQSCEDILWSIQEKPHRISNI